MTDSLVKILTALIADSPFTGVRQVETAAGVGKDSLSKVLRRVTTSPSIDFLEKIAATLDTDAASILGGGLLRMLPFDRIYQSLRVNPRQSFDSSSLHELAASIDKQGLLEPLIVRPDGTGKYEIIAGERRYRAVNILINKDNRPPDTRIPAIVRDMDDRTARLAALVENMQREDVSPLDEAHAFAALRDRFGMPTQDIAQQIGKGQRHVQMRLKLLDTAQSVQQAMADGVIGPACARALAGLDVPQQDEIVGMIRRGGLAAGEAAVREYVAARQAVSTTPPADPPPTAPDNRPSRGERPRRRGLPSPGSPTTPKPTPNTIKLDMPAVFQSEQRREGFPLEVTFYDADNNAYGEYRLVTQKNAPAQTGA